MLYQRFGQGVSNLVPLPNLGRLTVVVYLQPSSIQSVEILHLKACFFKVLWIQIRIRIHLAVLDPGPYWEMRIRIQQYENLSKFTYKPSFLPF